MDVRSDILILNKKVGEYLIKATHLEFKGEEIHSRPFHLIFPDIELSNETVMRITGQELKVLFSNLLEHNKKYLYSIETPTRTIYGVDKNKAPGRIDITIYDSNNQNKLVNMELIALNPDKSLFQKDIIKIVNESILCKKDSQFFSNWFHTLNSIRSNTLDNIFGKLVDSLNYGYNPERINKKSELTIIFCFIILKQKMILQKVFEFSEKQRPIQDYVNNFFKFQYQVSSKFPNGIKIIDHNDWDCYFY